MPKHEKNVNITLEGWVWASEWCSFPVDISYEQMACFFAEEFSIATQNTYGMTENALD